MLCLPVITSLFEYVAAIRILLSNICKPVDSGINIMLAGQLSIAISTSIYPINKPSAFFLSIKPDG